MECTSGVRTAPMGAGWTWDTLADSACSHHIPSLAPAVALPAPRHDRRRTGAAGSPPGGFPFVELTSRDCEIVGDRHLCRALLCAIDPGWPRTKLRSAHARAGGNPGPRTWVPAFAGTSGSGVTGSVAVVPWTVGTRFATGRSPCGAHPRRRFGRIAQLVEQLTLNQRVPGSSPGAPTNQIKDLERSVRNGPRT